MELKQLMILLGIVAVSTLIQCIYSTLTTKCAVKKSNINSPLDRLKDVLPSYIQDAESSGFKNGAAKKEYVLRLCKVFISGASKKTFDEVTREYTEIISNMIETYLAIPQATKYKE